MNESPSRALMVGLLIAILFYLLLPNFGWAWHRVLPEHEHIFIGTHDAESSYAPAPDQACPTCAPDSSFIHLPKSSASILSFTMVVCLFASIVIPIATEFSARVRDYEFCPSAPCLPLPDPPPNRA